MSQRPLHQRFQPPAAGVVPRYRRPLHLPNGKVTLSVEGRPEKPAGFVMSQSQIRMVSWTASRSKVARNKSPRNRHGTMQLCLHQIVRT